MRATVITAVETNVDRAASTLFGGACGYATFTWLGMRTGMPLLAVEAVAAAGVAYWLSFRGLGAVRPSDRKAPLSVFDLRALEAMEAHEEPLLLEGPPSINAAPREPEPADELLLTELCEPSDFDENPFERAERRLLQHYQAAPDAAPPVQASTPGEPANGEEPLLLDDVLTELAPDSRVVRLFDPEAMPTPGQLKSRIDQHIAPGEQPQGPDAKQALNDALAELRRSMR